jgi:peptidylprolyl isomerase
MSEVKTGDTVRVHYTGHLDDGNVFDSSEGGEPLAFTVGSGEVIPGFDHAVLGLSPGESKKVTIPAEEAYGARRDELVVQVPRERFPDDFEPEAGMRLNLDQNGQVVPVTIADVSDSAVVIDGNHPLAGENLTFDLKLVDIN